MLPGHLSLQENVERLDKRSCTNLQWLNTALSQ